jgi:hypothetical protein
MTNLTPSRLALALVLGLSLVALPALADDPTFPAPERPYPGLLLHAQADNTPTPSSDPTMPAVAATMPAIRYATRTDPAPVFQPTIESHQQAMEAARAAARPAPAAHLANR